MQPDRNEIEKGNAKLIAFAVAASVLIHGALLAFVAGLHTAPPQAQPATCLVLRIATLPLDACATKLPAHTLAALILPQATTPRQAKRLAPSAPAVRAYVASSNTQIVPPTKLPSPRDNESALAVSAAPSASSAAQPPRSTPAQPSVAQLPLTSAPALTPTNRSPSTITAAYLSQSQLTTAGTAQSQPSNDETGSSSARASGAAQTSTSTSPIQATAPYISTVGAPAPDMRYVRAHPRGELERPEYPDSARRNDENGLVELLVSIDDQGRVASATIARSSGYDDLDDAARKQATRWQFDPATRGDVPVASVVRVPVRFTLDDD